MIAGHYNFVLMTRSQAKS